MREERHETGLARGVAGGGALKAGDGEVSHSEEDGRRRKTMRVVAKASIARAGRMIPITPSNTSMGL